jgi:hypothetical protein
VNIYYIRAHWETVTVIETEEEIDSDANGWPDEVWDQLDTNGAELIDWWLTE